MAKVLTAGFSTVMARVPLAADFLASTLVLATGLFLIFRANVSPETNLMLAIGLIATGVGIVYVFGAVIRLSGRLSAISQRPD